MDQLSGLDASFLFLETAEMPMHVGALNFLELPRGYRGRFVTRLRQHMQSRLPLTPALRRKLWRMPLDLSNPAWVETDPDLSHHIVEIRLPRRKGTPGAVPADVQAQVARLHTVLLDRSRPLWKFHVFEGLAPAENGARRVAVYSQLHHAAVDGQAAVAMASAILDLSPEPRAIERPPDTRPREAKPGRVEMLSGAVRQQAQQLTQLVKALPAAVASLSAAAGQMVARSELVSRRKRAGTLGLAPRTRLNASVTSHRAFAAVSLPLPEVKALGRRHGATLNDMVLMLCSGALRRFFSRHGPLPRKSLVAAVPVSLRAKGDAASDNQASMTLVSLGTHLADPSKRLAHVLAATSTMKQTLSTVKGILPTDFPSLGVPWLLEAGAALYSRARLAERMPPLASLVISNVPGPPVPLYMAGARLLTNYPTSIVVHGVALNITVQSYDQQLDFGLMACAKAMPEIAELAEDLQAALEELRGLPPGSSASAPAEPGKLVAKKRARKRPALSPTTVARATGR